MVSEQVSQLTVCLPVYNAMPHLRETITSLLNQTFQDFRILIIDDGSSDESLDYLTSLDDPRITLIHQENQGLTATLNRMLAFLGTGWMVRQDADDIALPNRLKLIHESIVRFPNAGMIYSYAAHYQQGALKGQLLTTPADATGLRSFLKQGYLPSICHPTIALRVAPALELGGYRYDLHVEDYDLYWRVGLACDVHLIPEVLLGYRMTSASISDQNIRTQAVNVLFVQYLLLSALWHKNPLFYEEVVPLLQPLVGRRHLDFRKHMRAAMVGYGQKQYHSFAFQLAKAFVASPPSFLRRFIKQNSELARVGVSPELFLAQASQFWPDV
jgi:hypothetical protein